MTKQSGETQKKSKRRWLIFGLAAVGLPAVIVMSLALTVVVALAFFVILYLFLVQPHQIMGIAMEPTYKNGAYVLTDKISYKSRLPKRGEIVVYENSKYGGDFIHRIIGLPGDRISISNGKAFINDLPLEEPYLYPGSRTSGAEFLADGTIATVPVDQYFVLGDNREHSTGSQYFGFVSRQDIIGRVMFCYTNCGR